MDQLKVLQLYLACRAHFNSKYDIFENKARIKNVSVETLNKNLARKLVVERIARQCKTPGEVLGYIVPQYVYSYGQSLFDPQEALANQEKWTRFKLNPTYHILSDLQEYDLNIISGDIPEIFKLVTRGTIQIESAIALQKVYKWIDPNKDYFIFESMKNIIVKSERFLQVDENRIRQEISDK
jgi:hypothetical protein